MSWYRGFRGCHGFLLLLIRVIREIRGQIVLFEWKYPSSNAHEFKAFINNYRTFPAQFMNRFEFLGLMILSRHDSVFLVGLAQSSWEFQNQPDSNREFTPINANEAFRLFVH